jgi:hypothetical protein
MPWNALWQAILIVVAMGASSALAAPACPFSSPAHDEAKAHKLYLFFPAESVQPSHYPAWFPSHGYDPTTNWLPLPKFDTSKLKAYGGTAAQLREAIHDVVADIYCEFGVQVITIQTSPPTTLPRRNVVGIGVDMILGRPCDDPTRPPFGQSNTAGGDPGDSKPVDFARVWGGYYNCSDLDLQLAGWANSIGGTAAHEAAHNYGLSHADGTLSKFGEDGFEHHLMQDGDTYSHSDRAKRRHFSDFETSLLARRVGLAMDTMWTWEFINPNAQTARKLRMEVLSTQKELILSWSFAGGTSPWINPVVSGPSGTRTVNGTEYRVYQVEWSTRNEDWSGGEPGHVAAGARFQVGGTFSPVSRERRVCRPTTCDEPDAVIISDVRLFDMDDKLMSRRPVWLGFDAGTFDMAGNLTVRFFNSLDRPLTVRDVVVRDLPRVMSINAMTRDEPKLRDVFGRQFEPWKQGIRCPLSPSAATDEGPCPAAQSTPIEPGRELSVIVARRQQGRHISIQRDEEECPSPPGRFGRFCHPGSTADDLFPATTMYLTATIVDSQGVESRLFYQIAGRRARVSCENMPPSMC